MTALRAPEPSPRWATGLVLPHYITLGLVDAFLRSGPVVTAQLRLFLAELGSGNPGFEAHNVIDALSFDAAAVVRGGLCFNPSHPSDHDHHDDMDPGDEDDPAGETMRTPR